MGDNHKSVVDVPENPNKEPFDLLEIGFSDFYLHDNCYKSNHDQYNYSNYDEVIRRAKKKEKKEKALKHKPKEIKSNNPSLSKMFKDGIQKINGSAHQDKDQISQNSAMLLKCKVIQEYTKILDIIKEQNRNLEKIKTNTLSTNPRSNRQDLEQPYDMDKFNEKLFKSLSIQSKRSNERWPEIPATINIPKESSGCLDQNLQDNERQTASGEEDNFSYRNVSRSSSLEGSLYSSATIPDDLFKGLSDKVNSVVTCLNESKDINDQIGNLLKRGRNHLNHCIRSSSSSENCEALEGICEELRFVCNQKLKQISNENKIRSHEDLIERIRAGQNFYNFNNGFDIAEQYSNSPTKDKCRCSTIPAPSEITESDLCCCKPKSEPNEAFCCSNQEGHNIDHNKVLSIFKHVKDVKKKEDTRFCPPPTEPDDSLMCEIRCLRKRVRRLEYENAKLKCIHKEQRSLAMYFKEKYFNATRIVEEHSSKIDEIAKQNNEIAYKVQDGIEETKQSFDKKFSEYLKVLGEERNKLKEFLKEKEMFEEKLSIVEENLKKEQEKGFVATSGVNQEVEQLKASIAALRQKSGEIEKMNDVQKQEIINLKTELSEGRKEASELFCKIKERFEKQMVEACERIRGLEEDLARERAKNCSSVKEQEYPPCKLQNSQLRMKQLQACVKTLIDQIKTHRTTTCCPICEDCNRK